MVLFLSGTVIHTLLPILAIISALFVITTQNPIYSVLNLIVLYILVAFYLIFKGITYIGLSYVIIYVGAIAILFLFILMMIDLEVVEKRNNNYLPLLCLLLLGSVFLLKNIVIKYGLTKYKYENLNYLYDQNNISKELFDMDIIRDWLDKIVVSEDGRNQEDLGRISDPDEVKPVEDNHEYNLGDIGPEGNLADFDAYSSWLELEDFIIDELEKSIKMLHDLENNLNIEYVNNQFIKNFNENSKNELTSDLDSYRESDLTLDQELNNNFWEGLLNSKNNNINIYPEISDSWLLNGITIIKDLFNNDNEYYMLFIPDWENALSRVTQISAIGDILYSVYHSYIYILSVILLLGMVGAILLTAEKNEQIRIIPIIKKRNYGIPAFFSASHIEDLGSEGITDSLLYFVFVVLFINFLLFGVNTLLSLSMKYLDKEGGFECGFTSFVQTRERFNIIFYRVALLFLIFDLEIILIFPYTAINSNNQTISKNNVLAFLYILVVGFIFELKEGALEIVKKAHPVQLDIRI